MDRDAWIMGGEVPACMRRLKPGTHSRSPHLPPLPSLPPQVPTDAAAGSSLAERFLATAVPAANRDLWGSLSCTLLVHPATEAANTAAVQRALDDLQYGSVVLNSWSVTGFIMPQVRSLARLWGI